MRNFYERRLSQYGSSDPRTVAWNDRESQRVRFDVLSLIGGIDENSILDPGCGVGDFWEYLKSQNSKVKYLGIDNSAKLIAAARLKLPDGNFEVKNILDEEREFDYVLASGIFGLKTDHPNFKKIIRKMFRLAQKGVAFNMLSAYADKKAKFPDLDYFYPERIFRYCKSLTPLVTLRHDYLPHDFTIYLYK